MLANPVYATTRIDPVHATSSTQVRTVDIYIYIYTYTYSQSPVLYTCKWVYVGRIQRITNGVFGDFIGRRRLIDTFYDHVPKIYGV